MKGLDRNPEERRYRYLAYDELRRLTEALANHSSRDAANAVRLLLLTGARRGEVLSATWDQFDLAVGVWTKPSSHTKQKREHRVPLSASARQLLADMRTDAERRGEASPYLFPARTGEGPIGDIKKSWAALCKAAGINGGQAARFTPYLCKRSRQRGTAVGETVIEGPGGSRIGSASRSIRSARNRGSPVIAPRLKNRNPRHGAAAGQGMQSARRRRPVLPICWDYGVLTACTTLPSLSSTASVLVPPTSMPMRLTRTPNSREHRAEIEIVAESAGADMLKALWNLQKDRRGRQGNHGDAHAVTDRLGAERNAGNRVEGRNRSG